MSHDVFLIDDDEAVRDSLTQSLSLTGLRVRPFAQAQAALDCIAEGTEPLVVVSDVRLGKMDGLSLLGALQAIDADLPIILITGHGDVPMAVHAMRSGALDFIEKPFSSNRLTSSVSRAIEKRRLVLENRALKQLINADHEYGLVGQTPAMRELRRLVKALGPASVDVLILGETGTGKEVVARALHEASGRRGHFVAINCGALPESVFESEVFGHEAGSFTGASKRRIGKFEYASGGTVFLDEIETMPLALQTKLLRTLQERSIERLGSNAHVPLDCKVVAGTKVDLVQAYQQGSFRADLYYRLEVATVRLPPLRQRQADIPLLFTHFLAAAARRHGVEPRQPSPADLLRWQQHDWPGNVRELKNLAERWSLGLEPSATPEHWPSTALADTLARTERACIEAALAAHCGNVALAAQQLDVPRKTLYDKLSRLSLDPARFRPVND